MPAEHIKQLDLVRGQPRVRSSAPKRRSGCLTCKARHIRCDESRPTCTRCIDSRRECRYHDPQPAAKYAVPQKKLLPKGDLSTHALWSPTSGSRIQNERDHRYFKSFEHDLAPELPSGFKSNLWSQLVLQAAESEPIFRLTVATAALREAVYNPWPSELENIASHRQYALTQYSAALKSVRKSLSEGKDFLRTALISSLLIFCFENMLGDTERAVRNVQSALHIIHEQFEKQRKASSGFQPPNFSLPVEEEIVSAFMRLDRPAVALLGRIDNAAAPVANRRFGATFQNIIVVIPEKFTTITEARSYLERIRYRIQPKQKVDIDLRTSFTVPNAATSTVDYMLKSFAVAATYDYCEELLAELEAWHLAFSDLYRRACSEDGESTFVPAEVSPTYIRIC